jgi:hypothetical protein
MAKITDGLGPSLAIPKGLSRKGRNAAYAILRVMKAHGLCNTGGCRAFYTPKEWEEKGNSPTKSHLVVVFDGGDLYEIMSYNSDCPSWKDEVDQALGALGVYAEAFNSWSCAVYD